MRTITAAGLKEQLDRGSDVLLVNALEPETFEREHVPGSYNVPEDREDFVEQVTELAEREERPIVVYCSSKSCQASVKAGLRLEAAGFTAVSHFKGGMAEWKAGGYEVERGAPAEARA